MKAKSITVRFNLKKEDDQRAFHYLQTADQSYSKVIIAALNTYMGIQQEEDSFFQKVRTILREELGAVARADIPLFVANQPPTQEAEENVMAFLDCFDGEN